MGRPAVEQREAHLVRHDGDAAGDRQAQVGGVDVRQAQLPDEALPPELVEVAEGVEPDRVVVGPGVELQQLEPLGAQPRQRTFDRLPGLGPGHRSRLRHPLGERLRGRRLAPRRPVVSRDDLGGAVVVGHVEGGQARRDVALHGGGAVLGIELAAAALHVGDLPQPGQDPGDRQARRQRDAGHGVRGGRAQVGMGHRILPGWSRPRAGWCDPFLPRAASARLTRPELERTRAAHESTVPDRTGARSRSCRTACPAGLRGYRVSARSGSDAPRPREISPAARITRSTWRRCVAGVRRASGPAMLRAATTAPA